MLSKTEERDEESDNEENGDGDCYMLSKTKEVDEESNSSEIEGEEKVSNAGGIPNHQGRKREVV